MRMRNVIKNTHELFIDTPTDGVPAPEIKNEHLLGIAQPKAAKTMRIFILRAIHTQVQTNTNKNPIPEIDDFEQLLLRYE